MAARTAAFHEVVASLSTGPVVVWMVVVRNVVATLQTDVPTSALSV